MSSDLFPERIDAVKLFARNGAINAVLPVARLMRLSDCLANLQGRATADIAVTLQFGTDEEGRLLLTGTLDVPVELICQRCLGPLHEQLHCALRVLVLDSEAELLALPDERDAVVAADGDMDVPGLIEDELLLSLPLVPKHLDQACNKTLNALHADAVESKEQARAKPFAALAQWKTRKPD